ncbi:MAG: RraA family protein [Halobacteriota archaeon]
MSNDITNNFEITFWKKLLTERGRINVNRLQNLDAVKSLSLVPTPMIADAMDGRNVIEGLRPVLQGGNITGPVITVKTEPWDWGTIVTAIESAQVGDVILIDSLSPNTAVWGGLASLAAQNRGVVGSIVYGACRDIDVIKKLKFPVWTKSVTPRAGKPLNEGQINIPITIGESTVEPSDIMRADTVGVVFVPSENVKEVASKVKVILQKERAIEEGLKSGRNFSDLI